MDTTLATWTYKRDARIRLPFASILWTVDDITYLRPEVQLLHKAKALRPQDQADFTACLPLLDSPAREWLRGALDVAHPGHVWLTDL